MQTTHSPEMIRTQWCCYLVNNVISDNYIPVFHASLPFIVYSMPRKYRSCYNWRQKILQLSKLVKSTWQSSIKAKDWVGVLVSSGFIIGQDVETLHSSRESNQLRNSNGSEYVTSSYVQSTAVYQKFSETQQIFPANQVLLVSPGSSWTMTLVSNLTIWCPLMSFFVSAGSLSLSANVG